MVEFDRHWKEVFVKKASSRHPVLQPAEHIYENVRAEIFGERKRKPMLFWWLGGLLSGVLLTIVLILLLRPNQTEGFKPEETRVENSSQVNMDRAVEDDSNISSEKLTSTILSGSEKKDGTPTEHTDHDNDHSPAGSSNPIKQMDKTDHSVDIHDHSSTHTTQQIRNSSTIKSNRGKSDNAANLGRTVQNEDSGFDQVNKEGRLNKNSRVELMTAHPPFHVEKEAVSNNLLAPLPFTVKPVLFENKLLLQNSSLHHVEVEASTVSRKWSIGAQLRYGHWSTKLNESFSAALEPADFYSRNMRSAGLALSLKKPIGNRVFIDIHMAYDRIHSQSGHNSLTSYLVDEEQVPNHNIKDMTLGTPYGLIQSKVNFRRSDNVLSDHEMNILVNSEHRFSILSIRPNISWKAIEAGRWGLHFNAGPEISFVSGVENSVHFQLLNTDEIEVVESDIINGQDHVNSIVYSIHAGVNISYDLSNRFQLYTGLSISSSLNPLYENDDFKTHIRGTFYNIGCAYKLTGH